jgi:hypothetical protein
MDSSNKEQVPTNTNLCHSRLTGGMHIEICEETVRVVLSVVVDDLAVPPIWKIER